MRERSVVVLGVTGCIAAYKAIEVMRGLQKAGVAVQVVLTRSGRRFVAPLTFEALSGRPVISEMFAPDSNREIVHIRVAQEAALLAVVPATANILGKFARGIADDFLSTLYLSCACPVLLAPAMNSEMWNHPAVRENLAVLRERGHRIVEPAAGMLACGTEGVGRLAETKAIIGGILEILGAGRSMAGLRVLVTAGPTIEDIDPVRFISSRSSGKMGYALATAARMRGASVMLISGPTSLPAPAGVDLVRVRSAADMKDAVLQRFPLADIVLKAAAVSDFRPLAPAAQKLKKDSQPAALALALNEDILALLGESKKSQVLVGFAAETEDILNRGWAKMAQKNLDMIVVNDVSSGVFGQDRATVHLLRRGRDVETLSDETKTTIAHRILDAALDLISSRATASEQG
ncbi:MAG: bifunctional phosphopantothenoylcysteine decarboxylase/phosphopantothenate--cysteine ligase CoaBC [Acidobacteria bacterium]|nr:bifunctional phosphopantothenoylcysteine decarboxylase/phosphopantothenate--cysteine ligase CoaBC [Acidobacteriota bacterium]